MKIVDRAFLHVYSGMQRQAPEKELAERTARGILFKGWPWRLKKDRPSARNKYE